MHLETINYYFFLKKHGKNCERRLIHIAAETAQYYVILVSLPLSQRTVIMATSVQMVTAVFTARNEVTTR